MGPQTETVRFAPEDMALGVEMDHACKNRVDNIQRIASSQGALEWWRDVRGNDVKLQLVLRLSGGQVEVTAFPWVGSGGRKV